MTTTEPVASYRTNLVTVLLGMWFTIGLFLDAWAHNNVPDLETFFTPWHAVFYSGFAATAAWVVWTARDRRAIPPGYRPAAVAVVGFALSGIGDATWHTVFGIEQDLNILFSPTHLGLAASMLVIVTTPLRSAWADPDLPHRPGLRRLFPAVLSVALATALILLFLQYANAFTYRSVGVIYGLSGVSGEATSRLVGSFAVTTAVLVLPLLTLARRWALPFGTATMVFAFAGTLSFAVTGFHNGQLIAGLLVCGVCADTLAQWLRPSPDSPLRYRLYAALVPLLVWTAYIAIAWVVAGSVHILGGTGSAHPEGVVELYTGAPLVQALLGLLLAVLLAPGHGTAAAPQPGTRHERELTPSHRPGW
jgi:hypothetical protein